MTDSRSIDREDLPRPVLDYIDRSPGPGRAAVAELFADDASVTDEGVTHSGRAAIARWLRATTGTFEYTLAFRGAEVRSDGSIAVLHHMTGDFPGGEVDLTFVFTLQDGLIAALVFE